MDQISSVTLSDETKLPIHWVFGLACFGIGLFGSALLSAVTIGVLYSRLSVGQETTAKDVMEIKIDRTAKIHEGEEFQKEVLGDLREMKADIKFLTTRGK